MRPNTLVVVLALCIPCFAEAQDGPYRFVKEVAIGGAGGFDYLSVDPAAHRLFVSNGTRLVVVDTEHGKVEGEIGGVMGVHGIAVAPDLKRGFVTSGGENAIAIVDLATLKTIQKVSTGKDPDTVAYDPVHHNVYAFGKADSSATVFDGKTGAIVASYPLGGVPQATVVDAKRGKLYVNLQDKNAVGVIDLATHQRTETWSVLPCEGQSGLAIDLEHQRLFVGCRNRTSPLMVMVDATNGKVLAQVPVGPGVDASAYDPGTRLAFSSAGDGTLTIAREDTPGTLTTIQTLKTRQYARTMALDPTTHRIYVVVPDFEAPTPGQQGRPKAIPGTLRALVYEMGKAGAATK